MAPEQRAGLPLSPRTDALRARAPAARDSRGGAIFEAPAPSASDVHPDAAVERVIRRCLTLIRPRGRSRAGCRRRRCWRRPADGRKLPPAKRRHQKWWPPPSDVPVSTIVTLTLLLFAIGGNLVSATWRSEHSAFTLLQPPHSTEVLGVKAPRRFERLRPGSHRADVRSGFIVDSNLSVRRTSALILNRDGSICGTSRPTGGRFWQRSSPIPPCLSGFQAACRCPADGDPPPTTPGMQRRRETDLDGRLTLLRCKAVLGRRAVAGRRAAPVAAPFREAGLISHVLAGGT